MNGWLQEIIQPQRWLLLKTATRYQFRYLRRAEDINSRIWITMSATIASGIVKDTPKVATRGVVTTHNALNRECNS